MFENSNKDVLRELSQDNYRSHKMRNRLAILAVILTTILITAVLTVGISVTSTILNYGESAPGPGSIGSITGTEETRDQIRRLPHVVHADYIEKCSSAPLRNQEFSGMSVYLMAAEQSYYDHNYVTLEEGHFPENPQEVILSDNMIEKLGLKEPVIGQQVTLQMAILEGGETVEREFTFTVCGYFKNPLIAIEDIYDEIYTSMDFIPTYNPELEGSSQQIYVSVDDLNPFLLKTDVTEKLAQIADAVGEGFGTKYTSTMGDLLFGIIPAGFFVLFIILSGYFLIYNVFYLSITNDIRWFGMLKTLGTTAGQLKKILMTQIRRLSVWGICIGVCVGYVVGNYLAPGIMADTIYGQFYKAPNMILIFILGALFSWITVYISAHRSLKLASKISPVEAANYTPKKRKNLFTIISFALSGIMFMAAANVTLGYSVERMVDRYNMDDMTIMHKASYWWQEEPYQPIQTRTVKEISKLPFVKSVDLIYMGRSMDYEISFNGGVQYEESLAEFKMDGSMGKISRNLKKSGYLLDDSFNSERNSVKMHIRGLSAERLMRQIPYMAIREGKFDEEKFATGDYLVWVLQSGQTADEVGIHAGDTLPVSVYDEKRDTWHTKDLTILAVAEDVDMFGVNDLSSSDMAVSTKTFQELFPDYETMISKIQIQTDGEITPEESKQITAIYEQEHSTQLQAQDRASTRESFGSQKQTMSLVGMFLASLFGIIGISNMVNTITSDIFSRKIELAAMQSIGMTKKQLWWMLFVQALRFSMLSVVIMLPVGSVLAYYLAQNPIFTGFSLRVYLFSTTLLVLAVVGLCMVLISILVHVLNQKSVVERLREIE